MSIFDWNTETVTLGEDVITIDSENPLHVLLAETARDYDRQTENVVGIANSLARAATRIAESAADSPSALAGLGYEQMATDIAKAQAKREALNEQLGMLRHLIRKEA